MNKINPQVRRWSLAVVAALAVWPVSAEQLVLQEGMILGGWDGPLIWNGGGGWVGPGQAVDASLIEGFSVADGGTALEDTPAGEAFKFMQAGDWLKAIESIEALDVEDDRLVTDPGGILRPLSSLKSALIASMPEEGQKTFRRLNNPAANTSLKSAHGLTDFVEREQAYQAIVRDYALCDAAAEAANTLGDIRFEQGRFDEAAALFRFAAEHPAAAPDDAMLMAKRLLALSRAGLWEPFNDLAEYALFRHPTTNIALGGQDVAMRSLIRQTSAAQQPGVDPGTGGSIGMPAFSDRLFNRRLLEPGTLDYLRTQTANYGMAGAIDSMTSPIVTSDGARLYTLMLGSVARLDPQTGTDLWREGDPYEHANQIANRSYQLQQGYHQALVLADDTLLCVVPEDNYPNRARLIARDAETGKQLWSTKDLRGEMRNRGIVGEPIVVNDTVYAATQQPGEAQLKLLSLSLKTGKMNKLTDLGTAPNNPNTNAPAELSPRLTMGQGYLFVQTNNGALIAVDPNELTIAWAFSQKIRTSGMGHRGGRWGHQQATGPVAQHTGEVVTRDGLVIAKDTRSGNVHAFREYDASLVWAAATEMDSTIVHADHRHVYVLGGKVESNDGTQGDSLYLVAHDLKTGKPAWWSQFAGTQIGQPVFTDKACLVAGSSRFNRIDLATGKVTDSTDEVYDAAQLTVIGDTLIRATNDRITAYRIPQ